MRIEAFGDHHLTTYKIKTTNKVIMFDFCSKKLNKEIVKDVDIIFLSHEHYDHIGSLLNYNLVKHLKENIMIFSTETTKEIIKYKFNEAMKRNGYNDKPFKYITKLVDNIKIVRFRKKYNINDLSFEFYRSGHTFASSMVYLITNEYKLLYTGDMDYAGNEENRKYDVPYNLEVDYIIADGTNLFSKDYKGVNISKVRKFINKQEKGEVVYYNASSEKAVLYALTLANKINNAIFLYTDYLKWYLKILYKQEYNVFVPNKVMIDDGTVPMWLEEEFVVVKFCQDYNEFCINNKLSLHITKNDFINFIENHLLDKPKKIYIGHYNYNEKKDLSEFDFYNAVLLKEGVNDE